MTSILIFGVITFAVIAATVHIGCKYIPYLAIERLEKEERKQLAKENWLRGLYCLTTSFLLAAPISFGLYRFSVWLATMRQDNLLSSFEFVSSPNTSLWVFPSLIVGLHIGAFLAHLGARFVLGKTKFAEFMNFQNQASGFHVLRFSVIWGLFFQIFSLLFIATLFSTYFALSPEGIEYRKLGRFSVEKYRNDQVEDLRCLSKKGPTESKVLRIGKYCEIQFSNQNVYRFVGPGSGIDFTTQTKLLEAISVQAGVRLNHYNFSKKKEMSE